MYKPLDRVCIAFSRSRALGTEYYSKKHEFVHLRESQRLWIVMNRISGVLRTLTDGGYCQPEAVRFMAIDKDPKEPVNGKQDTKSCERDAIALA